MQLSHNSPGRLVFAIRNAWAYVPSPLPPRLEASWSLLTACAEAERELAGLSGLFNHRKEAALLHHLLCTAEVAANCRLDGEQCRHIDLLMWRAMESEGAHSDVERPPSGKTTTAAPPIPLQNYQNAIELGVGGVAKDEVNLDLIRQLHAALLACERDKESAEGALTQEAGQFRSTQTWLGASLGESPSDDIREAAYVPPPPPEMHRTLADLEHFIGQSSQNPASGPNGEILYPPLIRLALIHYQIAAISPFVERTGIINRLTTQLLLTQWGLLPAPTLLLSRWLEANRDAYHAHLRAVSFDGAWEEWLVFFLRGLAEAAADTQRRAAALLHLRDTMRAAFPNPRASSGALDLLDHFFATPLLSLRRAADLMGASFQTTSNNMNRLLEKGFVDEITGGRRGQRFLAREIFALIEENKHVPRLENGR